MGDTLPALPQGGYGQISTSMLRMHLGMHAAYAVSRRVFKHMRSQSANAAGPRARIETALRASVDERLEQYVGARRRVQPPQQKSKSYSRSREVEPGTLTAISLNFLSPKDIMNLLIDEVELEVE